MFEAKKKLISEINEQLKGNLTAEALETVSDAIAKALERYDVVEIPQENSDRDDLLDVYLSALQVEGKSPKTIERYRYVIRRCFKTIGIITQRVTVYDLRRYLANEKARGIADSTLESTRQILSAYYNWLIREGLIKAAPTANLGVIKCAKVIRKPYSDIEMEKLKMACTTIRDRAIVTFLASTGCRISEMTGLNREDLDLNQMECVVHGKGNKERTVYLSPIAVMTLQEYLSDRKDLQKALFIGKHSERLTSGGVRRMLRELGLKSGVDQVHPHRFRRTLATNLIKHGMPIEEVASILGHDKLDTTMKYVVLYKDNVKNAYQRYA